MGRIRRRFDHPVGLKSNEEMIDRTKVIVRLGSQNRMVTKGYRKGVYSGYLRKNLKNRGIRYRPGVWGRPWFGEDSEE
jgi:hypothetical protein